MSTNSKWQWGFQSRPVTSAGTLSPSLTPTTLRFQAWKEMRPAEPQAGDRTRRVVNIVVASLAILLTAPLMLVIAVLVKLTSPGPVIYKQQRVGLDRRRGGSESLNPRRSVDMGGRIFTMYKFRTMYADADTDDSPQVWASDDDPRITPVGRVLRAFRLDELPQMFNVLKGDMNVVGPRPEQPDIFAHIRQEVNHYSTRQRVLPGITGLAQVSQGYDASLEDVQRKVKLDLKYIRGRSAGEDLLIMAKTLPVVVRRQGWK